MPQHRFYLDPASWQSERLELTGEEAHHCRDVMRCGPGEKISVFDGKGRELFARISDVSKKTVRLDPEHEAVTSPLPAAITLGQAIPKGKSMDLIIQKATELGVSQVVPVISAHTVVQINEADLQKKQEKWQRIAIEACKQCGQNWLPRIARPVSLSQYLNDTEHDFRLIAALTENAQCLKERFASLGEDSRPRTAQLLIGPEGDFTAEEVELAIEAGFHPVSLGPIVLRSETAAIYLLSVMVYELMNR